MKARVLERTLATMGAAPSALDLCTRELRRVGMLPIGGRGPNAPEIDFTGAASMLVGLACSSVASQAGDTAIFYASFVDPSNPYGETLLAALSKILGDQQTAHDVDEIRFCRSMPWVMFVNKDGTKKTFHPPGTNYPGDTNKYNRRGAREEYVIGSLLLHQIAIDFAQAKEI